MMFEREPIRAAFSEMLSGMFSVPTAAVWMLAILVAVVAGPFGTFEAMDTAQRALFWFVVVSVSLVLGYVARCIALLMVGHERPLMFDAIATMSLTLIFTPILWVFSIYFSHHSGVEMPTLTLMIFYIFIISVGVYVMRRLLPGIEPTTYSFLQQEEGSANFPEEMPEPRLLKRLSADVQAPVLRLSGRDHYVEVVTEAGEETLRLRLADAINETEPVEGVQPHRSHWVARSAIDAVERENGYKLYLKLKNGDRVPVSRGYRPRLEELGVIESDGATDSGSRM